MKIKQKFKIVAGPCLAESEKMVLLTAEKLAIISAALDIDFYFKASYRKANRTSIASFEGVGDELALSWIARAGKEFCLRTLTDVHSAEEARLASQYVDVLQIPAFLARQTELLTAASATQKIVNIKKGQFMAPGDMKKAAAKVTSTGNNNVWLTERGTFFGYHDLTVDFRSIALMKKFGFPVIYDATHSVQQPSIGEQSGGRKEFIEILARAAVAVGADGIFFETHPNPLIAKSDAATQLPLKSAGSFIRKMLDLHNFLNE